MSSGRLRSGKPQKGEVHMIRHYRQRGGCVALLDADSQSRVADLRQRSRLTHPKACAHHENEMEIVPVAPAVALGCVRQVHARIGHGEGSQHFPETLVRQCFIRNLVTDVTFHLSTRGIPERSDRQLATEVDGCSPPPTVMLDTSLDPSGQRHGRHLRRGAQRKLELFWRQGRFQHADAVALPFGGDSGQDVSQMGNRKWYFRWPTGPAIAELIGLGAAIRSLDKGVLGSW